MRYTQQLCGVFAQGGTITVPRNARIVKSRIRWTLTSTPATDVMDLSLSPTNETGGDLPSSSVFSRLTGNQTEVVEENISIPVQKDSQIYFHVNGVFAGFAGITIEWEN